MRDRGRLWRGPVKMTDVERSIKSDVCVLERNTRLSHSMIYDWMKAFYEQTGSYAPAASLYFLLVHAHIAKNSCSLLFDWLLV